MKGSSGADPDLILPGQVLNITCTGDGTAPAVTADVKPAVRVHHHYSGHYSSYRYYGGILSPSQIGALWLQAGGSPGAESTAECIAHFESGGNPRAVSPTDDYGLFQINASWGSAMASFDPLTNAESAVKISDGGRNWSPWTTAGDCGV